MLRHGKLFLVAMSVMTLSVAIVLLALPFQGTKVGTFMGTGSVGLFIASVILLLIHAGLVERDYKRGVIK